MQNEVVFEADMGCIKLSTKLSKGEAGLGFGHNFGMSAVAKYL